MNADMWKTLDARRHYIGGSDARIIMGNHEDALVRLWREKAAERRSRSITQIT
jgi:predicted phage-related endonuclease